MENLSYIKDLDHNKKKCTVSQKKVMFKGTQIEREKHRETAKEKEKKEVCKFGRALLSGR